VTALNDPDPRVSGAGHQAISEAGIELETGVCKGEATRDHAGFLQRERNGRPLVTLKLALSIDGRIATASGDSQWITGPAARRIGHVLRANHDAVLVGGGTARADNPKLTVRGLGRVSQPVRVVASAGLNLPAPLRLVETLDQSPVWVLCGEDADARRAGELTTNGVRLLRVAIGADMRLDPKSLLDRLGSEGLTRVYCEGGGTLAASLLGEGLVDRMVVFTAGIGLGGDALPGLSDMGLTRLSDAAHFRLQDVHRVGSDTMTVWERPL
jgi:diaminohydroxyphosphoribosylaminopyrimidine deaminase/5-amino-6-(5-phosphoribosylamino)uracil reductase